MNGNNQHLSEPQNQAQSSAQRRPPAIQLVAYGTKAAVQCEQSVTQFGWYTVSLESAPKANKDPEDKSFNWKAKITLQLTKSELPVFIAVAFGLLPSCRFDLHGDSNKWVEVINQGANYYFKIGGGGVLYTAPLTLQDMAMFGSLALAQYTANFPSSLSSDSALNAIKVMASLALKNNGFKPAQNLPASR